MVGMQVCFQTPHGGEPFHYWKKGYGFGHSRGPGTGNVLHPAAPVKLRFGPSGDRGLAYSPFWRGKSEVGPASSFGIGDRPPLSQQGGVPGPDNYGDISVNLQKTRRNATREGIKLKPRFPSMEEKYRDLAGPQSGPGPAKYNTSIPAGQSSWSTPAKACAYSFGVRSMGSLQLREDMGKQGFGAHEVRRKPGKNSAIQYGTLYDISMGGRVKRIGVGEASPGPAKYQIRGQLDEYGLGAKIANVKGPPAEYWRDMPTMSPTPGSQLFESEEEASSPARSLTRVESSPL